MTFDDRPQSSNELILNPGEYAFLQDKTTGNVQTHVGPLVVTQSGQLRPIKFEKGTFSEVSLHSAVRQSVSAKKGEYLILRNPTVEDEGLKHPSTKNTNASVPELRHGEKIVIQGPVQFALWPEQDAEVVEGHNLRDDQFLVVRVYDKEAAVTNWTRATIVPSDDSGTSLEEDTPDLTLGQLLVIKDVSFYIPATGIEVVPDSEGNLVRDALTLEMSEYAILVDQSGNKRYEKGPQIVFPEPTEEFFKESGCIKFKPIELTPTQGLHLKVNCAYTDENWPGGSLTFQEGEEIFITGETHPIYYPCEEQSIIRYGDNLIHYATAVPLGQARYVMDKNTGEINTVHGPAMLLLDPTQSVFVQRVLSDNETLTMYPGNTDSLEYNRSLRQFQISKGVPGEALTSKMLSASYADEVPTASIGLESSVMRSLGPRKLDVGEAATPGQIERKTTYTKPHSVTLDNNRFSGVPTLKIWTGSAVLLVRANGERRVEVGPKTVTLEYDETLQALHLSTGKPKTTDNLLTTGYLEVSHNKVSDVIEIETEDGVKVNLKVSYRVSFVGNPDKWFNIDNYVKFLCDNCRSRLKGASRKHKIREFNNSAVDIVRDTLLGKKIEGSERDGLLFEENGMHLTDVDLLKVEIIDGEIGRQLISQQQAVITDQIAIDRAEQHLEVETANQRVEKAKLTLLDELRKLKHELDLSATNDRIKISELEDAENLRKAKELALLTTQQEEIEKVKWEGEQGRHIEKWQLDKEIEETRTKQIVERFKAAEGDVARAINQLGDQKVLETVAEAVGPMSLIGDINLSTIIGGLLGSDSQKSQLFNRLTTLVDSNNGSH